MVPFRNGEEFKLSAKAAEQAGADSANDSGVAGEAPERPQVIAFTDANGAPCVVDSVDGEFRGEHLDIEVVAPAEGEVDAAIALKAKHQDGARVTAGKAVPRKRTRATAEAVAAGA